MTEIQLTRKEKKELRRLLFYRLNRISEYHNNIMPRKRDKLDFLMVTYFHWGDAYNDGCIPEKGKNADDKLSLYLAQEFDKFMEGV